MTDEGAKQQLSEYGPKLLIELWFCLLRNSAAVYFFLCSNGPVEINLIYSFVFLITVLIFQ